MAGVGAQVPNLITVLRVLLLVPIGWWLWQQRYADALALVIIAGLSDALDGLLARRFGWTSRFGAILDPAADKLLVLVLVVVLTMQGHLPLWLAAIVIGRDLVIVSGAGVYRLLFAEIEFAPTKISKINTALQIIVIILLLIGLADLWGLGEWVLAALNPYLFAVLATVATLSGIDYVITWSRRAMAEKRRLGQRSGV